MQETIHYWGTVILPVFLGSVSLALINIVKRKAMKGNQASSLQFLMVYFGAATIIFALSYLMMWGFSFPDLLPGFWSAVFFGSAFNIIIQWCNVKAASLDKGEVSLTAPLQAMTPGLITVMAILLGEIPSFVGILGVILMAGGSYVLLFEKTPMGVYEFIGPLGRLRLLFSNASAVEKSKALVVLIALLSAFMGTFGLLFDGLYVRRGLNLQGLTLGAMTFTLILTMCYFIWYKIGPDSTPEQARRGFGILFTRMKWDMLTMGTLWVIAIFLIYPPYNSAMVAHVGTLKRFQIGITFVLGLYVFQEAGFKGNFWNSILYNPEIRARAIACALIILGAFFLSQDGLPSRIETRIVRWGL